MSAVHSFQDYMLARARKETAQQDFERASLALNNAQIWERLAEIENQHEPLTRLLAEPMTERERLHAAAFYVVCGRLPAKESRND